ncbi:methylenetetrahydrofolate reductase [NAD(P)H] [Candidatus Sumerlaeota bacterium]|nr:methylenetetrahydrofolate reductase [NAD(P)H] [Candidatus Sumerlaeota bacterium]
MNLNDAQYCGEPFFSFEFYPPQTDHGEILLREAALELAELGPAFFSMTYGAGGSTRGKTVVLAYYLQGLTQVDTVCHLTCVGQSKDEVRGVLRDIELLGMRNVLALRGDPPQGKEDWQPHPDGFQYASELIEEIKHRGTQLSIGVAGFPEKHPDSPDRESDLKWMKRKIDCGADAVITQLFFDNRDYFRYVEDLRAMGVETPVIPGILPVQSVSKLRRFCDLCQARIPDAMNEELSQYENDDEACREYGVRYAVRQIAELLENGAPGVHLYCLNKSWSARRIFAELKM